MGALSAATVRDRLVQSYALDRLWGETMGLASGGTKEGALRAVVEVLQASGTRYAVIGGVAVQMYAREPRTTLDVDVAVAGLDEVPRDGLIGAGFRHLGRSRFGHSDDWTAPGPEGTVIAFSCEDIGVEEALSRAQLVDAGGFRFRLVDVRDLFVLKLAAAEEPSRSRSKRLIDLVDLVDLAERYPEAGCEVPALRRRFKELRATLLTVGLE